MSNVDPPFSSRVRGKHQQIDEAFPDTAITGLHHLVHDLVDRRYVASWGAVARELQRIGRLPPEEYDATMIPHMQQAKMDSESALNSLSWHRVYDFCERLHDHLAIDYGWQDQFEFHVETPKHLVQEYIAAELQRLFLEEDLAYEFAEGKVVRRGRKHTAAETARAQVVLGDIRLADARRHYAKALKFFRDSKNPDYENAVKESVCACEAAGKVLFPESKASTLGDLAKWMANTKNPPIPKALANSITAIYAYRSGGDGVGHGGSTGGVASASVAEYVLSVSASMIIYFVDLSAEDDEDIPF